MVKQQVSVSHTDAFVTRIWAFDLSALLVNQQKWLTIIAAMREAEPTAGRSNRCGWSSSNRSILEKEAFKSLRDAVGMAIDHTFKEMKVINTDKFNIAVESWVNSHDAGGFNVKHMHTHAMLSGSFYLKVPEGSGDIVFSDPRPGSVHAPIRCSSSFGSMDMRIQSKAGQLILFPNYLEHFVLENKSDSQRVSISMNVKGE